MAQFSGEQLRCVRGDRTVFDGLDFAVGPGGALLLTGANGSGKSSLLRLMAGLARPDAGRLCWDDSDIADDPGCHAARLCYVGHLDALKPVLTVGENLAQWARLHDGRVPDAATLANALARFDLAPLADIPVRMLSAGQRRRLALARLTVSNTMLWLLDEPTVALDAASVSRLMQAIADHRAGGGIAVISTNVTFDAPRAEPLDLPRFAAGEALDWAAAP